MFYFFSKTISYLLTPAGWLLGTLLYATLVRNPRRRRWAVRLALAIFYVCGNPFLVNELALGWEYPLTNAPNVNRPAGTAPVIAVVLTGGIANAGQAVPAGRFLLHREADRAGQALYLYQTGAVQKILISGGMGHLPFRNSGLRDEGNLTAQFLRTAGVRPADIMLENQSVNTHENAVFTSRLLRKRFRTNRCVLVTSAVHMRRAVACFRKEGIDVKPFAGAFLSAKRSFAPGDWLLPNEQAFENAYFLSRELVGYVTYWAVGYL